MSIFTRSAKRRPNSPRTTLSLDALETREVPSATLDLTARGSAGAINDARFVQYDGRPTGTGVIDSFVRVQALGNKTSEQGYNTSARPLQYDENKSPQFTRGVTVGSLPLVSIGGVNYREVQLDINQKASASTLSLDELRVYVGTGGSLTGYTPVTKTLAGLSPVYDLDAGGDHWVKLDARLNTGSGSGDMLFYVPNDLLGSASNNFYLYSKFGMNAVANGGFEEWAAGVGGNSISPESSSLSGQLFGSSTFLAGATVILTFADGSTDEAAVVADGSGGFTYQFNNVLLGGTTSATLQIVAAGSQMLFIAPTNSNTGDTTVGLSLNVGTNTQNLYVFGYFE